jgi:hypothetical protein
MQLQRSSDDSIMRIIGSRMEHFALQAQACLPEFTLEQVS